MSENAVIFNPDIAAPIQAVQCRMAFGLGHSLVEFLDIGFQLLRNCFLLCGLQFFLFLGGLSFCLLPLGFRGFLLVLEPLLKPCERSLQLLDLVLLLFDGVEA